MSHLKLRLLSAAVIAGGGFALPGTAEARGPTCAPTAFWSGGCPGAPALFCSFQYGGECGYPTNTFCQVLGVGDAYVYCWWGDA